MTSTPYAFSCGKISSGNRVIIRIFEQAGVAGWVVHGTPIQDGLGKDLGRAERRSCERMLEQIEDPAMRVLAVIPVRSQHYRRMSIERHTEHRWATARWNEDWMMIRLLDMLMTHSVPTRLVSYEALVLHPEAEANDIMEWAGLEHRFATHDLDWLVDGNEKYREAKT